MKKYYYIYYSYEEWGRGYIGKRSCKCKPEEDVRYFGSYKDKTFKPTKKIILETYDTAEELAKAEEILHEFYDVRKNSHFANQHNANGNFYLSHDSAVRNGKMQGERTKKLGIGIHRFTQKERIEVARKGGQVTGQKFKELGLGIFSLTEQQKIDVCKMGGKKCKDLGIGIFNRSKEEHSKSSIKGGSKGGKKCKKLGIGIFKLTKEQRSENSKRLGSQRWQCTETGFISSPGSLSNYQKARGIDTSKRIRLE